jgi:transposase
MRATAFFRDLVTLTPPWKIERVVSFPEQKLVRVFLHHAPGKTFRCPECAACLPVRDHVAERSWRHLDSGSFVTELHARLPRVACLFHGVRQVHVPWALPHARYTKAFEQWAIDVLRETDVLGATRLLRISWDEAWHLMERAVVRGRRRKQCKVVQRLGVDEKAIAKGHKYLTLICDLDSGHVEYLADDRKKSSLDEYYQTLSAEQLTGIEAVAMDMWEPFIASTTEHVPAAAEKIVFDRFHIMQHMGKSVDDVRKREHRLLRAEGDETLTGTKYWWLYGEENLPEQYSEQFAKLKYSHLKTARAWALKECLRELWLYQRRGWAERHWQRWYGWATRSRLPEVRRVARMLKSHLPNVLTYFAHRITNAVSEGVNSKIQGIKKTPVDSAIESTSRPRFISTVEVWNSILGRTNDATRGTGAVKKTALR